MSIDWLLTRIGCTESGNVVTKNTGDDITNREKVNNSRPKKARKNARNAKVLDRHLNEYSHCNSQKQENS